MMVLRLFPVVLSSLLIAAHFQRAGLTPVAVLCLLMPLLLFYGRPISVRLVQIFLLLAACEWLRTLVYLVQLRMDHGLEWTRLALIIGSVALLTFCSVFVFRGRQMKHLYSL